MSTPGWLDEEGSRVSPARVYYDKSTGHLACHCQRYRDLGRCSHLVRWRPTVTVWALEIYL